jgi:hypothetical protein
MSPMLLPYWSDTCIGSMEGLYFEASATTPYHFINQGELSAKCSCAQRWDVYGFGEQGEPPSPYRGFDFDLGIKHLQLLGVRYYMAFSTQAVTAADQSPALTPVTTSGPWHIYEIADSAMVTPLANQPAVVTGIDPHKGWVHTSVQWYDDATKWDVMLAESGPSSWQRVTAAEAVDGTATAKAVEQVDVSNITTGDDRISFDVDKVGSPVLVKASYFPNWQVSGAEGPYRVTPNLMVVVPTSKHVSLHYGWTPVDMGAWLLTFAGLGLVALLALIEVPAGQLIQRGLDEQKRRDLARLGHQPG